MLRGVFLLLFLLLYAEAKEYPKLFETLGTPLFDSSQKFSAFKDIEGLSPEIQKFQTQALLVKENGLKADSLQDKKELKRYLLELRKLQKNYDFLLHLIHKEILQSIKKEEYEKFILLTSTDLDGLLENQNIKSRSLHFYANNKSKKKSALLEKIVSDDALLEATTEEFFNIVSHASFDSNDKKSSQKMSVSVYTSRTKDEIAVYFLNANPYDVTVFVQPRYTNIKESPQTQRAFAIKAKSRKLFSILKLTAQQSSYSFSYSWIIGDMGVVHDDAYLYRLPFKIGSAHRVSQGYNGTTSHKGSSQFAIDFSMAEGTKVYAAREGVVVKTKSDSSSGGFDKKYSKDGNYITISHSDGTFATYYHLKRGGVRVNVGERVAKGAHIGYSGNTGYSSGPHLHFAVFRAISPRATHTVAVRFLSANGIILEPKKGEIYEAN